MLCGCAKVLLAKTLKQSETFAQRKAGGWWRTVLARQKGEKGEFFKRNGSLTLQDICEAMGTRADNGELVGTFGDFAVTSSPGLIAECFRRSAK